LRNNRAAELISRALAGDEPALARLVDRLTPVIQARVVRTLLLAPPAERRGGLRQQLEDLCQEVFLALFADGGRVLRSWEPERGLSLDNFVGLVARRRALSFLRSGRGGARTEDPAPDGELERAAPESGPEADALGREQLRLLLRRLEEELSPLGWHLFRLLLVEERPVEEVERATRMSRDALYAWRSRLRRHARRLVDETTPSARPARCRAYARLEGCSRPLPPSRGPHPRTPVGPGPAARGLVVIR
jgi:RNA polymerase sigma-70 factor (ECF subfamily)